MYIDRIVINTKTWRRAIQNSITIIGIRSRIDIKLKKNEAPPEISPKYEKVENILRRVCPDIIFAKSRIARLKSLEK